MQKHYYVLTYSDYVFQSKYITTGLCIATTGIYFDYIIITGPHKLTAGIKISTCLCIAITGVYFDYLIITGSDIVTTGTKILLRVYIFSLRVQVQSKYNLKNQLRV